MSDTYKDANFNFKHFQKLLERFEGIKLSYSALYGILTHAGINNPKKKRKDVSNPQAPQEETSNGTFNSDRRYTVCDTRN
ncbi:MAG: hypothetical protein PWP45_1643 [Tepidanaerobacteraceae bacterium]|nr:hypothetical protein [Tepidanaerobacteraceae bacterium]